MKHLSEEERERIYSDIDDIRLWLCDLDDNVPDAVITGVIYKMHEALDDAAEVLASD
jgi:hypothetical protein